MAVLSLLRVELPSGEPITPWLDEARRRQQLQQRLLVQAREDSQAEMRKLATENSKEIRDAVEDGKKRMAHLIEQGAAAALIVKTS